MVDCTERAKNKSDIKEINHYIIYKDSRMLEEYEILKEILEITSIGNTSHATVKIVFRRRIEYHIKKTFLQVLINVIILLSFEFNKAHYFYLDFCSCYDWVLIFLL